MKVYARQISPEYQESYLFFQNGKEFQFEDDFYNENVTICGNDHYCSYMTKIFKRVWETLENGELAEILDDLKTKGYYSDFYKNATEAIEDFLYREDGKKHGTKAIHKLKQLVTAYTTCKRSEEDDILCDVLSIVTAEKYTYQQIKGSCQGDWNYIYYPSGKISEESVDYIEACYFNTGSEWIIHDEETEPESPEDIQGYSVYCVGWNDEQIRKELAKAAKVKPEEVIMFAYDHSVSVPVYRTA